MRTFTALLFVAAMACAKVAFASAPALTPAEKDLVDRALRGQKEIFARNYPGADVIFESLSNDYPTSPAGPFGKMAVLEMKMLEQEDFHLEKGFLAEVREGTRRVDVIMQKYEPTTWDLFLSGALMGLDGFFKARKGQWWDAYTQGGKSRQLFKHVKELDPSFADADFGLGMYIYWRSVFSRDLWFLRMFPDKRAEGISIVEGVARDGHFAKDLAKVNLAIMYFEERRFKDASRILSEYLEQYPNNVILRKLYGKVLISLKSYDDAVGQFRKILTILPEGKGAHYFIGVALVLKGDPESLSEAENELTRFLKMSVGNYWPAHAHYWLGRLNLVRGQKEAADREFAEAVKLYPEIESAVKKVRGLGGGV